MKHACHVEEPIANAVGSTNHVARKLRAVAYVLVFAASSQAATSDSKRAGQHLSGCGLDRRIAQFEQCFFGRRDRTQFAASDTSAKYPGARDQPLRLLFGFRAE